MLKHLAGVAVVSCALAGSVAAQPLVYQFEVQDSDMTINGRQSVPDKVPYQLGILTLGQRALHGRAQYSTETNPITDDHIVKSWLFTGFGCDPTKQSTCPPFMSWPAPPNAEAWMGGPLPINVTIDLKIGAGRRLSGTIDVVNDVYRGCYLSMTGHRNVWIGTWGCDDYEHSFTATSVLANPEVARH